MRVFNLLLLISMFIPFPLPAQVGERYIEVTGTSEIEVVPDRIHYVIEIREYFEEEFDGVSKPEEYRTKVPLTRIEEELKQVLKIVGVPREAIRTKDVGDNWRKPGQDFLVSKSFDVTLRDFTLIYNRQNEKYEFYKRKVQEETFEYSLNEVRTSLFHSVILYPFERSHIEFKQDIFTTFN